MGRERPSSECALHTWFGAVNSQGTADGWGLSSLVVWIAGGSPVRFTRAVPVSLQGEQEEYAREGIAWSYIDFVDNQDCLDL